MKKMEEYEEACHYYENDNDPEFTLKEAINKFEALTDKDCNDAYYDLYCIYLDNEETTNRIENLCKYADKCAEFGHKDVYHEVAEVLIDIEDYNHAIKYLRLSAIDGNEEAWYLLAKVYKEEDEIYEDGKQLSRFERLCKAIESYFEIKSLNKKDREVLSTLDDLQTLAKNKDLKTKEKLFDCYNEWLKTCKRGNIKTSIKKYRIMLFNDIINARILVANSEDALEDIRPLLDNYSNEFDCEKLMDSYYSRYGDFLFEIFSNYEDIDNIISKYEKIRDASLRNSKIDNVYITLITKIINEQCKKVDDSLVLKYFRQIRNGKSFLSIISIIKPYIGDLINKEKYEIALEYAEIMNELVYDESISDLIDKSLYLINCKKAEKNYEAQLYVARALVDGIGVEQNKQLAYRAFLKIFVMHKDEISLGYLREIKKELEILKDIEDFCTKNKIIYDKNYYVEALNIKQIYNFEKFFKESKNAVKIDEYIRSIDMGNMYPDIRSRKCNNCFNNKNKCNFWYKYNVKCSNEIYRKKYYEKYTKVNDCFLSKIFSLYEKEFKTKKHLTIVLVGCGNLYEISTLNNICIKNPELKIDVIVLDEFLWLDNDLDRIRKNMHINSLWIKKCNFYLELQKEIYSNADLIYYSRCIIPHSFSYNFNKAILPLKRIIRKNQLTIFSEVLNVNIGENGINKSVEFENMFKEWLANNYTVRYRLINVIRKNIYDAEPFNMLERIQVNSGIEIVPLLYMLFILDGRK